MIMSEGFDDGEIEETRHWPMFVWIRIIISCVDGVFYECQICNRPSNFTVCSGNEMDVIDDDVLEFGVWSLELVFGDKNFSEAFREQDDNTFPLWITFLVACL